MICFEEWTGWKDDYFEIIPTVFSLFSSLLCDAIDDCSLKLEIWRICALDDSHTVGFSKWLKFFTETILKTCSVRRGSYLFYSTWKPVTCVLKRWKCGCLTLLLTFQFFVVLLMLSKINWICWQSQRIKLSLCC